MVEPSVVTAAFSTYFYIESQDRRNGIKVSMNPHGATVGQLVSVLGKSWIGTSDGERYITATGLFTVGSGSIDPVAMPTHSLGGAPFLYDPGPKTGQMGTKAWIRENGGVLTDLMGLNNVGLFVTVCGKVTGTVTGYFFMDDGSGFDDGDPAKSGIKVALPTGVSAPAIDTYVVVTGISSSYKTSPLSSDVFRLLRPRQASDIIPLDP